MVLGNNFLGSLVFPHVLQAEALTALCIVCVSVSGTKGSFTSALEDRQCLLSGQRHSNLLPTIKDSHYPSSECLSYTATHYT